MKRFIFYLFTFFIVAPCLKLYTDTLTDNTTGPLYLATANFQINGVSNPLGHYMLLLWELFPWLAGIVVLVELLRWVGGRKQDKNQQYPFSQ